MEPFTAVLAGISAAKNAGDAARYIDRYAKEHDLTREQAAQRLLKEAARMGNRSAEHFLRDYLAHQRWRRKHKVVGVASYAIDPTGVLGVYGRRTRRWWKSKPK